MTSHNRSLQLRRLVILKSARALYDEQYHPGANIIRGENSSGKSTIANYIFYMLGGDLNHWTPEASSADTAFAEISIDNKIYTLCRDIEAEGQPPLSFFEGDFEGAINNRETWLRYPYRRSANTESFSQVIFRMLNFPEQVTETNQSITIHQVLRLLYNDQLTPVNEIFRHEEFDPIDFRVAIGELLLGIDDLAMHEIRIQIRGNEKRHSEVSGELKSLFSILGQTSDSDITVQDFHKEIEGVANEQDEAREKIEQLISDRDAKSRSESVKKAESLRENLRVLKQDLFDAEIRDQNLSYEIADSTRFIETINERLEAIDSSKSMAEILGTAKFSVCPACLSPIQEQSDKGACHLCHAPLSANAPWRGHLKMREELAFQRKESERLLAQKVEESAKLQTLVTSLREGVSAMQSNLDGFTRELDPIDAEIGMFQKRLGYLEKTQEDLQRKVELASLVQHKIDIRDNLQYVLTELRSKLELSEQGRKKRRVQVEAIIKERCVNALHRDLHFEQAFRDAVDVEFSFRRNKLSVDGRSAFSASSHTYLKNSFLFSLFQLSLVDFETRWPRFLLMDNIEDKGMQPERSANFQEYVVECSAQSDVDHQIIMTTSMISPKLEDSDLCVGPHYDENNKTLKYAQ